MAKGSKMKKRTPRNTPNVSSHHRLRRDPAAASSLEEENMDDEIDAFHKQWDVIPIDVNGDAGDASDEDDEQPVLQFEDGDFDSDDSGGGHQSDGEDDNDIGHQNKDYKKIARQKRFLEQKFGGVKDDMYDDVEGEEQVPTFGQGNNFLYGADNIDFELLSDDEDLAEEEALVVMSQKNRAKSLLMGDFGLEGADEDESDSNQKDETLQDTLVGEKSITKSHVPAPKDNSIENYEEVKKDLNSLTKEEQMDVVNSSAPELVGLLSELNEALDHLQKVKTLLCKAKDRKNVTKGAMHYLETKHILLLAYCQAIGFYLLLKSEGHPVFDHPVIARLVEIKNLLDKVKKIDDNIPPLIEEIVDCDLKNEPGKKGVKESVTSVGELAVTGVPAKTSEVKQGHEMTEFIKVGSSKDYDYKHGSQKQQNGQVGLQSLAMLKVRASLEEKLKQKGIYNSTTSKSDGTHKCSLQNVNRRLETLADFDDEVADIGKRHGMTIGQINSSNLVKLSQLIAVKHNKPMIVSGDDDLPKRDDIGERRRKYETRVLARTGTGSMDDGMGDDAKLTGTKSMDVDLKDDGEMLESEDEFYNEVKKQRLSKLSAKATSYSRDPVIPSSLEAEVDGKRHITYQMEKNKGLTRSRKKLTKIPRKKYKMKHEKAVVRRKGQVRDIRKPTGPYGGEASGINTRISRSVRFKN